jgi:hypothetical protein
MQRIGLSEFLEELRSCLLPRAWSEEILAKAGLWPSVGICSLLRELLHSKQISETWSKSIRALAHALKCLQRYQRLFRLAIAGDQQAFSAEYLNSATESQQDLDGIEPLIFEIEQDIRLRQVQVDVARDMISPPPHANSLIQLTMGQGKTKVILPTVACLLADGTQLVQVVLLKQLLPEMLPDVRLSLGGLISKPIVYLPISRSTKLTEAKVNELMSIYQDCMSSGAIIFTTRESLLSLQHLGYDHILSGGNAAVADKILTLNHWIAQHGRVIIDEADAVLDHKYEQCYALGSPTGFSRW